MTKFWAYTLLIPLLASTFHRELGIAYFYSFRDYISQEFCINSDQPELQCDGMCFLKDKVLEENKDADQPELPPVQRVVQFDFHWDYSPVKLINTLTKSEFEHFYSYINEYKFLSFKDIAYPPWFKRVLFFGDH